MFGLSAGEILLIAIVALIFIGPDKLPALFQSLGKGIREVRRHSRDLQDHLEHDEQLGQTVRELRATLRGDELRPRVPYPRPAADTQPKTPAMPAADLPEPTEEPAAPVPAADMTSHTPDLEPAPALEVPAAPHAAKPHE